MLTQLSRQRDNDLFAVFGALMLEHLFIDALPHLPKDQGHGAIDLGGELLLGAVDEAGEVLEELVGGVHGAWGLNLVSLGFFIQNTPAGLNLKLCPKEVI